MGNKRRVQRLITELALLVNLALRPATPHHMFDLIHQLSGLYLYLSRPDIISTEGIQMSFQCNWRNKMYPS